MLNSEKIKSALLALGEAQLAAKECFGGAMAVMSDGETVINECFGDERFNERSIFRLASVTKLFTAAAVVKLHSENKIDIYSPVSRYLPDFKYIQLGNMTADGRVYSMGLPRREITLFDLLTHTAGLGAGELGSREYTVMRPEYKQSLEIACDYYAKNAHLAFEPGSRAAYSGFAGYDVLARVIEVVLNKSFNDYLTEEFFVPLGMGDTTFQPTEEQYSRIVPMHKRISGEDREIDFKGTLFRGLPRTYEAAGAALVSSMRDILTFCRMLLSGGGDILTKDAVDMMLSPKLDSGLPGLEKGENNCFGCFIAEEGHRLPKGTVLCHGAYGTHVLLKPEEKFAAVFLKNSMYDMTNPSASTIAFEKAVLQK